MNKQEIASAPESHRNALLLPLIGDRPQMLPQGCLDHLNAIFKRMRTAEWSGVAIECGMPGDLDPYVFYLARGAFDAELTPDAACKELVAPICGPATVERLLLGFRALERASSLAAEHDPDFSTPRPDVIMKHYKRGAKAAEWWKETKEGYLTCLTESLRAKDRSLLPGRPWLRYIGKRMEFAYEYMNCVEHVQAAGQARDAGDSEAQLEHLEAAVEAMYNSLRALGEVAEDQSDRGVIAVLAEYGYRPLVKELEKAEDAAE